MKKKFFISSTILGLITGLVLSSSVLAEELKRSEEFRKAEELPEIVVKGERILVPTKETAETVYTGTEITPKGIEIRGQQGSSTIWSILSILPGIMFESPDFANLASTYTTIRVRGVSGGLGTMSVEGIPIYGGNPIGPRHYLLDSENLENIGVYKGIAPVELGTGAGTRGGVVELRPKWAKDKLGIEFNQALGMFDYLKSYVRVDSGKITPYGTKLSLSYSYTEADKWRGKGKMGPRNNVNFTLVQPIGESINIKLWVNYNDISHHKYRSLSYAQADNLSEYRRWDYNTYLTGNSSVDWQYYKFFKVEWSNWDFLGFLNFKISPYIGLELKPYYREEEKDDWEGSSRISGFKGSKPGVTYSGWTVKRYGLISQIVFNYKTLEGLLGYHYQDSEWIDVPGKNYWLNPDGSLNFVGWGRVLKSKGKSPIKSPFVKLSGRFNKFNWQIGLKYLETKDSKNIGYITKYTPNGTPYLEREPLLDHGGKSYSVWLPSLGLSYNLNPNLEVYLSAGRTFQTPYMYMPIVSLYYRLYDKFRKLGITLNDLFKDFNPEKTDNIDLGLRVRTSRLELYPTIYFSKHKNLNTPITPGWKDPDHPTQLLLDPTTNRPVSFNTFVGKAKGYGFELSTIYHFTNKVSFFFNPSYVRLKYDGNITSQGITYRVDGKQVVNVPKRMLVSGIIMSWKGLEVVPMLRYVSKAYGDLRFTEKIPEYTLIDLKLSYTIPEFKTLKIRDFKIGLELYNLLDKKYFIPGYYPGPPFTLFSSLSFKF
ncbi:MAG: TonB-dependent receptor [Thermodesulfobacteriaceae bacterium]|nr:TonB-dependent receptor [Thermodesulfobacteriaceae bacterium]MDW8135783.1 TonB-dependent receptor [Thermodesulfobacterium sp.]